MTSPIARKQRLLYPDAHPLAIATALRRTRPGLGRFGGAAVGSAAAGASTGATVGSMVPVIGTAIGAIGGAIGGVIAGAMNRSDVEVGNFNQAIAMWSANRLSILSIANKYLVLAGIFDLTPQQAGKIRIYHKYGRMGEARFLTDMCNLIYQAAQQGQITASDTPQTIYQRIVLPWEDSWGFGPEPPNPHTDFMDVLLMGLIADYVTGRQRSWVARDGKYPFGSLPAFSLPTPAQPPTTTQATPTLPPTPPAPSLGVPATTMTATAPSTTTVAIPAGFSLVGAANGLQAYQGADGYFYSWNGTTMSPLTGTLSTTGGQSFQVNAGTPVQAAAAAPVPSGLLSTSQYAPSAGPDLSAYGAYPPVTAPAQPVAPIAAGVTGAGLPPWVTWGAMGGVLLILFATARPIGTPKRGASSKRRH